jgi:hypothetical protein
MLNINASAMMSDRKKGEKRFKGLKVRFAIYAFFKGGVSMAQGCFSDM